MSACAVGSSVEVTTFVPSAKVALSRTTTAPKGPPRRALTFSIARSMARCMKWFCIPGYFWYCKRLSPDAGEQPADAVLERRRLGKQAGDQECLSFKIVEEARLHKHIILFQQFQ